VWQDHKSGNWDIYIHDVATGTTKAVSDSTDSDEQPSIWGDIVVWQRKVGNYWRIISYDIDSGAETQVSPNQYYNFEKPDIWEDKVVYVSYSSEGNWDVYLSTLGEIDYTRITSNPSVQWMPKIFDDRVVWQDNRNGNWDIYMYTISTGEETRITWDAIDQVLPSLGRTI
jgi:beta propeller repeat protein